jgi:hypothetical protein
MKSLTEIRRGCGKTFDINDPNYITFCGVTAITSKYIEGIHEVELCEVCQALLEQAQEFEKMIDLLKSKAFKTTDYYDQVMAIKLDDLNELLKEVQGERE